MVSPRKEMVVGRLKVRVRGLSRSAAHKRIFILGSSVCCERAGEKESLGGMRLFFSDRFSPEQT